MGINEIKKALYKEKPIAVNNYKDEVSYGYETTLKDGTLIYFKVPLSEMGEKLFSDQESSQLLIRWII